MITSKKSVLLLIETEIVYIVFPPTVYKVDQCHLIKGGSWGFCPIRLLMSFFFLHVHTTTVRDTVVTIIAYISKSPCIE